jgi:thiol-disulfide isomerase/thioredoxin
MPANKRLWLIVLAAALAGCTQQPAANPQPADVSAAPANEGPGAPAGVIPAPEPGPGAAATTMTHDLEHGVAAADGTAANAATTPATAAPDTTTSEPVVDAAEDAESAAKAKDILGQTAKFYQGLKSFKVTATLSQKIQGVEDLPFGNRETKRIFAFEKPNKGAFRVLSDADGDGNNPENVQVAAVSDGQKLNVLAPGEQGMRYARMDAPATLTELMAESLVFQGLIALPLTLGLDDPEASLMEGVTSSKYVGLETLGEVSAHRLSFVQPGRGGEDMTWDMWIASEGQPLVLQIIYDQGEQRMRTPDGIKMIRVSIVDQLQGWEIDAAFPVETFVFTPPEGAKRVRSLTDPEPSPLLGKAAPPIKLALVKEGELDLANHAGKDVVMLDFWATWCGPCVAEMPILAKVAQEYADKGVVLYAVNLREEVADIEEFFKDKDFTATVALDTEGSVGDAYGAEGIPHLVIIDKKGVVQSVHTGYSPDIEETLHKELDAILAGVNIYEELLQPLDDEPAENAQPGEGGTAAPAAETPKPETSGESSAP